MVRSIYSNLPNLSMLWQLWNSMFLALFLTLRDQKIATTAISSTGVFVASEILSLDILETLQGEKIRPHFHRKLACGNLDWIFLSIRKQVLAFCETCILYKLFSGIFWKISCHMLSKLSRASNLRESFTKLTSA